MGSCVGMFGLSFLRWPPGAWTARKSTRAAMIASVPSAIERGVARVRGGRRVLRPSAPTTAAAASRTIANTELIRHRRTLGDERGEHVRVRFGGTAQALGFDLGAPARRSGRKRGVRPAIARVRPGAHERESPARCRARSRCPRPLPPCASTSRDDATRNTSASRSAFDGKCRYTVPDRHLRTLADGADRHAAAKPPSATSERAATEEPFAAAPPCAPGRAGCAR
jgi:predicted pyridoxine 5'-phosphate oxidase superfamily flavin-nucleotide-binding protein